MFGFGELGSYTEEKRVEEVQMTVARITMAEFNSETEADTFEGVVRQILTRLKVPRSHKSMKRRFETTL